MKKYDESKCLANIARRGGKVDLVNKRIYVTSAGIHTLGKLDYLAHYCGWFCYIKLPDMDSTWHCVAAPHAVDRERFAAHRMVVNNFALSLANENRAKHDSGNSYRDIKKAKKEHKLTNKRK